MVQGCYLKGRFPALAAINLTLEDYLTGKEQVLHLSRAVVENSKKK